MVKKIIVLVLLSFVVFHKYGFCNKGNVKSYVVTHDLSIVAGENIGVSLGGSVFYPRSPQKYVSFHFCFDVYDMYERVVFHANVAYGKKWSVLSIAPLIGTTLFNKVSLEVGVRSYIKKYIFLEAAYSLVKFYSVTNFPDWGVRLGVNF